jgi:hypothetical protein
VDKSAVTHSPHPHFTPEAELNALANVYSLILASARKRGRLLDKSGPEDPERRSDEIRANTRIP